MLGNKDAVDIVLAIVQIVSLVALVIYVIKTWEMASATREAAKTAQLTLLEMKATREQESAPYVVAHLDFPFDTFMIYLVVRNVGKTLATDVRLIFEPPLQTTWEKYRLEDSTLIQDGIGSIPPSYEIRSVFDTANDYFARKDFPLRYKVTIEYMGGSPPTQHATSQVLDLAADSVTLFL